MTLQAMQAKQTTDILRHLRYQQEHLLQSVQVSPHSTAPTVTAFLFELPLRRKPAIVTIGQVSVSSPLAATVKMALNWVSPTATSAPTEAFLLKTAVQQHQFPPCLLAGKTHLLTSALLPTTNWWFKAALTRCLVPAV